MRRYYTGTRRVTRLDELLLEMRLERRISKRNSSRRVTRLVPVFILEDELQNVCRISSRRVTRL